MIEVIAVIALTLPNDKPSPMFIRPSHIQTLFTNQEGDCYMNMRDDIKIKVQGPCEIIIKKSGWDLK